ncbi:hypothetical protein ACLESD_48435, partial [Pyxidicoccus sp. 3LFB2]
MRFLCVSADPRHPVAEELRRQGQAVTLAQTVLEAGAVLTHEPVDVLVVEAEELAVDARWLDSLRMRARPDEPSCWGWRRGRGAGAAGWRRAWTSTWSA